jgi:hypothetical protein
MQIIFGLLMAITLFTGTLVSGFAQSESVECKAVSDAKKQIESLDRKYSEIKKKVYTEWESASKSGQYSGSWEEFAQKFLDSVEVKEIQALRQKYAEIDQKCPQYGALKPEYSDSKKKDCDNIDYQNIKKTFFTIEQKIIAAKERYYKEWESLSKSGKYSNSWDQYAKENLYSSSEALEYQNIQAKYGNLILYCQSESVVVVPKTLQIPSGCNESELKIAKKTLLESDGKVTALKERLYSEWKLQADAGKTTDSWDAYMKQRFDGAVEVKEWRQLQEKYASVIHICTPTNMDVVSPNSQTSQTEKSTKSKTTSEKKKDLSKSEKLKKAKNQAIKPQKVKPQLKNN